MGKKTQLLFKSVFDYVLSAILLIISFPIWFGVILAIKLDDGGPVFFIQDRLGKNGKTFKLYKFRTMIVNADQFLDEHGRVTSKNRITRVGKFLRSSSIDELPQLINILKGEMSIVGPRPALPEHFLRYNDHQKRRLLMKPGITGLAQIRGRNTLKWSQRIAYDIWYIDHYSLWLDVKILLKTIKVVLLREGIVMDRNPQAVDDLARPFSNSSSEEA